MHALALLLACGLWLAGACRPGAPEPDTPLATGAITATETAPSAETDIPPTPTTTPAPTDPPPRALLIAPEGADPELVANLQGRLGALAAADGLSLQTLPSLSPADLTPDVRVVVVLPADLDVPGLAASAQAAQFLSVGVPGVTPGGNLSVIGPEGFRPDQQAFLAGYLAAILTEDWRVGILSSGDTPDGQAARQGFLNGARYFCGLCRPAFPPFEQYPIFVDVAGGGGPGAALGAAEQLVARGVRTVYLYPGTGSGEVREFLDQSGVGVIGSGPDEPASGSWIATVQADPGQAIEALWSSLMAGEGGGQFPMPLAIRDVNPDRLSPGRLKLANDLILELMSGAVDTGVDPATGEVR